MWITGLLHPQKAVALGPRRLDATAEEAQPGATRPAREHVRPRAPGLLLGASDSELTSPTRTTWNRRWCSLRPRRVLPRTDLEARLERLFTRGRELAGRLIRPEVDILTGLLSRSSHWARSSSRGHPDYTPVEEVNILWAPEGVCTTGPQWCALHLPRVLLLDLQKGFPRRPLHGASRRR